MASEEQIATLRRMINEPNSTNYTDEVLGAAIDVSDSLDAVASDIWSEKAGAASKLVNVAESGSSRSLSQISTNALEMAKFYSGRATAAVEGGDASAPFVVAIERT